MIAVFDTNIILRRMLGEFDFNKGFLTPSVMFEIRNTDLLNYLELYMFKLEVKQPEACYINNVCDVQREKNLLLSQTDIEVVALTLQLRDELENTRLDGWITKASLNEKVVCISLDNGVLHCLKYLDCESTESFYQRNFMFRCASCYALYAYQRDFCKRCASYLITRVSIQKKDGKIKIFFKKGFKLKKKPLKDKFGNVMYSEDQKEYQLHIAEKNRSLKK